MRTTVFSLFACFFSFTTFAAEPAKADVPPIKYAVYFKDKANSPYSVDQPSAFLSARALERREKAGIRVDESDLPVNPAYIKQVTATGVTYFGKSNWSNYIIVGSDDAAAEQKLKNLPCVKSVVEIYNKKTASPDMFAMLVESMETKEAKAEKSLKGDNLGAPGTWDYGNSLTQVNMLGIDYMHSKGYSGKGKVIAVFDGGFTKVNELSVFSSLRDNSQILGTWDFVRNRENVYDFASHGMAVLSCIAGVKKGELIGTGPGASFFLLRSEDSGSETVSEEYNWEAAAVWADSAGADIISSSLGYTRFDNGIASHSYADMNGKTTVVTRAADRAASKGILVVNSAGNEGASSWRYIGAPADGDSVLAIGAVDKNRKIAGFSSRGPSSDGRIKPNVCAMGEGTLVATLSGGVGPSNGTSFSCPLISGAAATLWQANPDKTSAEILDAIQRSAHKYGAPDSDFGYGIPNFGYADLILKNKASDNYYKNQKLMVYPNPMKDDEIFMDFFSQNDGAIDIKVSDLNGKVVASKQQNVFKQSLNLINVKFLSPLAAGTYVLMLTEGKQQFSTKFLKQ